MPTISRVAFAYHMYGMTTGTLHLVDGSDSTVWSLSGNQGNSWLFAGATVATTSFRSSMFEEGVGLVMLSSLKSL